MSSYGGGLPSYGGGRGFPSLGGYRQPELFRAKALSLWDTLFLEPGPAAYRELCFFMSSSDQKGYAQTNLREPGRLGFGVSGFLARLRVGIRAAMEHDYEALRYGTAVSLDATQTRIDLGPTSSVPPLTPWRQKTPMEALVEARIPAPLDYEAEIPLTPEQIFVPGDSTFKIVLSFGRTEEFTPLGPCSVKVSAIFQLKTMIEIG